MGISLSIIVPAYNAEKHLPDCLSSILTNTYRNFEILLIDDGSMDGSGAVCDRFCREDPRIRVFHTENRGLPAARNLGIENAAGQFIGFVDADDQVTPDLFGTLTGAMDADIQMGICAYRRCVRDALPDPREAGENQTVSLGQTDTASLILRGPAGPYVWNKLYRKDILDRHHIRFRPDAQGAEDQFFNMEYLQHCGRAVFCSRRMYFYITTANSITSSFRASRVVGNQYMSLPRAWRYTAEVMDGISAELAVYARARAAMFYQSVLRKLAEPDQSYIREATAYVRRHNHILRRFRWGMKFYFSGLLLRVSYRLWAGIFRRGID